MTLDIREKCAVCAWRSTCAKKYVIGDAAPHCPDFTRDLSLGIAQGAETRGERHKQLDDVFGTRK